jgi:hypothetical protein
MHLQSTDYTAIVLVRNEEFNQWINQTNKMAGIDEGTNYQGDYSTYLVKKIISQKDVETFLKENFRILFRNELGQWHDERFWPQELTLDLFYKWFSIKVNREVFLI